MNTKQEVRELPSHVFETSPNLCHAVGDLKLASCSSVAYERRWWRLQEMFHLQLPLNQLAAIKCAVLGACAPHPLCCLRDEASPELHFENSGRKWVLRTNGAALQRVLSPPLVSFEIQARIEVFGVFCSVACRGLGEDQVLGSVCCSVWVSPSVQVE